MGIDEIEYNCYLIYYVIYKIKTYKDKIIGKHYLYNIFYIYDYLINGSWYIEFYHYGPHVYNIEYSLKYGSLMNYFDIVWDTKYGYNIDINKKYNYLLNMTKYYDKCILDHIISNVIDLDVNDLKYISFIILNKNNNVNINNIVETVYSKKYSDDHIKKLKLIIDNLLNYNCNNNDL